MKKLLLFFTFALVTTLSTWAQHEYSTLVVETKSGDTFEIWLYEKPHVQFSNNKFTITCDKEATGYIYDEVRKFYFKYYDPATGIDAPTSEGVIRIVHINQSEVTISGIAETDKIKLYTLDGRLIMAKTARHDDNSLTISLEGLPSGTYILNIGNKQSFKFLRR